MNWKLENTAQLYTSDTAYSSICLSYRSTVANSCSCKKFPDGNEEFFLNLDNKYLLHHGYPMTLLYSASEAKFPLRAASRVMARVVKHTV
jgi:hypothetical protein